MGKKSPETVYTIHRFNNGRKLSELRVRTPKERNKRETDSMRERMITANLYILN